jgi:pyruvate,orthophosphate dikinase
MTQIGLNVPPGFVISTEACLAYLDTPDQETAGRRHGPGARPDGGAGAKTGKGFGDPDKPLLVSVRSGSAMSMPGMMDTILNLGLNARPCRARSRHRRRALRLRRLPPLHPALRQGRARRARRAVRPRVRGGQGGRPRQAGRRPVRRRPEGDQRALPEGGRGAHRQALPEDPDEQLEIAIKAVFNSWMGKRAVDYRASSTSPRRWPTAPR